MSKDWKKFNFSVSGKDFPQFTFNFNPSSFQRLADLAEEHLLTVGFLPGYAEAEHHGQLLDGAGARQPHQGVLQVLHSSMVIINTKLSQSLLSGF